MTPALLLIALTQVLSAVLPAEGPIDPHTTQAVIETTAGSFVLEFFPDEAPSHVARFLEQAVLGSYTGTTFHSMVPNGIVQGGDPLTRDPGNISAYGTGGFHTGPPPEFSDRPFVSGTLATTLLPGDDASGGSQFFIAITDQPQFTGRFTILGHVVEGLDLLQQISLTPTDEKQIARERIEILGIRFRAIPPPPAAPFSLESAEDLRNLAVVMNTSLGEIVIGMRPELAPNHVRHVLRLVSLGVYDQTAFHRVAPGFVIQGGDLNTRTEPYPASAATYVVPIAAELSDAPHTRGTVSMARGETLDSALTSFFIVLADQPALDGVYTVFGEVLSGMETVDRIEGVPTSGEQPLERVGVYTMRVERRK